MDRIIKIIGGALIEKVEPRGRAEEDWSRRSRFVGFAGYLVIKASADGRCYAVIDDGRRCISTSFGELAYTGSGATFTTGNSVYTFRLAAAAQRSA